MTKELWFKKKAYGWGWTPCNAKGWISILIYTILTLVYPIYSEASSIKFNMFFYILSLTFLTIALIILCYKLGEKPTWQWGETKEK
jgi:hypothetical protein